MEITENLGPPTPPGRLPAPNDDPISPTTDCYLEGESGLGGSLSPKGRSESVPVRRSVRHPHASVPSPQTAVTGPLHKPRSSPRDSGSWDVQTGETHTPSLYVQGGRHGVGQEPAGKREREDGLPGPFGPDLSGVPLWTEFEGGSSTRKEESRSQRGKLGRNTRTEYT